MSTVAPGIGIRLDRADRDEIISKLDRIIAEQSEQIAQRRKAVCNDILKGCRSMQSKSFFTQIDRLTDFVNQTVIVNLRTSFHLVLASAHQAVI